MKHSMQQLEIKEYLKRFFLLNQCDLVEEGPGHLTIQLTIDMDKELMNRPFYWHYLEKTGGVPNPMKVSFITDQSLAPEDLKGEKIHFGSPRLQQIFQVTKKLSSYVRLFQIDKAVIGQHIPLHPWIGLNMKVSYQCDLKRDEFHSIGLHLITGRMVEDFHSSLENINLSTKIPDLTYTLSPLIKPRSGLMRIQQFIEQYINEQDDTWAKEARKRWEKDLALLDHFYEGLDDYPETYYKEKQAIQEQYEPIVEVEIINGGLYYLTDRYSQQIKTKAESAV